MFEEKRGQQPKDSTTDPVSILKEAVLRVPNTRVEIKGDILWISNLLDGYQLPVKWRSVSRFGKVMSPYAEECLRMDLSGRGFVIVTPNDYVFDVTQEGYYRVKGLPQHCSVRDLIASLERYEQNLKSTNDLDTATADYVYERALIESALLKGLDVEALARRFNHAFDVTGVGASTALRKSDAVTVRDFECLLGKLVVPEFSKDFLAHWKQYVPLNPWDFYFRLTDGLPGSIVAVRLSPDGTGAVGVIVHPGQPAEVVFRAEFDIPGHRAELNYLDGKDLSEAEITLPKFLPNLEKTCLSLGIETLGASFSGKGSHFGANAGFLPTCEE